MEIQWFPGHMTKALRMMEEEIRVIDLVIYVLDSRAPYSCMNPSFTEIIGSKPIIYVLNKADLGDETLIKNWASYFNQGNARSILLDSTLSGSGKKVVETMKLLLNDKIERNRKKGIVMPLRAMVIGVPNSGKSTLINNLCGKGKTITGNRPGVTRGKQWVKIADNIELMDTPGTLWPSFDSVTVAKHLAYIGSIRDQVLEIEELALELIKDLIKLNPKLLETRYNFTYESQEAIEIYEHICKVRGLLLKGGEFDYARGAMVVLDDFRKGKLGRITLDRL